jgi:hypothetical protein
MGELKLMLEDRVPGHLKADPSQIAYWPTPTKIMRRDTKSRPFLEFVHSWIYDDTSAEAHLKPGGLLAASSFLLKDRLLRRYGDRLRRGLFTNARLAGFVELSCRFSE